MMKFGSFVPRTQRETLARTQVLARTWPFFLDVIVAIIGLALFFAVVRIGLFWAGRPEPEIVISQSPRALPLYAFYSLVRIGLAYLLSLVFAVGYGYVAAYNKRAEALMIAALDILQSIPVLSFLPGVMLAMIALFPTRQLGVEIGAIILIFTGQVWNMAFSFYSSLKSIPKELSEAADVNRFSRLQRLVQLELPYGAIGLIWNSIMSVAGGWFFLMACEMQQLDKRDLRLPGLGSYLQTAASNGSLGPIAWGLGTMVVIIIATDQFIWRPIIAWSDKFKFEQVESSKRVSSPILHLLTHSNALNALKRHTTVPLRESLYVMLARRRRVRMTVSDDDSPRAQPTSRLRTLVQAAVLILVAGATLYAAGHALLLLRQVSGAEYLEVGKGALATFLRVNGSLLFAALWTIPAGVMIGFNPRLARIAQPVVQVLASMPAPGFFPVILLLLAKVGAAMGVGSVLLMLLAAQWYVLFNVIAGAMAIPTDLKEVATLFRFSSLQRWQTVILPGIFPFLITGLVTASGGAWNASIIAEYFHLGGRTLQTVGLGAVISGATASGQFQILLLATIMMALMVVTTNRLVWRPLYRLSETRYKLGN